MRFLVAVGMALSLGACSTITGNLMQRGPKGPDPDVLENKVCRGDIEGAMTWLEDLALPRPERTARLELARREVDERVAKAVGKGLENPCPCATNTCSVSNQEKTQ